MSSRKALRSNLCVLYDEYNALKPHDRERHAEASQKLENIFLLIEDENKIITHDHIRTASRLLIELLPEENLEFRAAQIRRVIDDLSSASAISECFERDLNRFSELTSEQKRSAVGELQRIRAALSIDAMNAAIFKADIINTSFTVAFLLMFLCALIAAILIRYQHAQLALFLFSAFFGVFGAWISTASRIRDTDPQALARHAELNNAQTSSIWISPLFGAIGAFLAYGGLKTGIIGNTIGQDIQTNLKDCDSVLQFFHQLTSKEQIGSTFLIALTSLAAGWSERLVPDMLEWVGGKVRPNATK